MHDVPDTMRIPKWPRLRLFRGDSGECFFHRWPMPGAALIRPLELIENPIDFAHSISPCSFAKSYRCQLVLAKVFISRFVQKQRCLSFALLQHFVRPVNAQRKLPPFLTM